MGIRKVKIVSVMFIFDFVSLDQDIYFVVSNSKITYF